MDLAPSNGWTPAWRTPLLVLLPIISVLLGLALLIWSVGNENHLRLLKALIPTSTAFSYQGGLGQIADMYNTSAHANKADHSPDTSICMPKVSPTL